MLRGWKKQADIVAGSCPRSIISSPSLRSLAASTDVLRHHRLELRVSSWYHHRSLADRPPHHAGATGLVVVGDAGDTVLEGAFVADDHIGLVIPAGPAGINLFIIGLFSWALGGFANVYYAIAQRMLDLTVDYVKEKTSIALGGGPYALHPEIQHGVAEMAMLRDAMEPQLDAFADGYTAVVADAANWSPEVGPTWATRVVSLKETVTRGSYQVADLAVELAGSLGVARRGEFERLFRDARMGRIHPANPQLAHEFVAKVTLGLDLEAQPRWA